MNKLKLSADDWCKLTGIEVMDPDGWDRRADKFDADWNREITFEEFWEKATMSTTRNMRLKPEEFMEKLNQLLTPTDTPANADDTSPLLPIIPNFQCPYCFSNYSTEATANLCRENCKMLEIVKETFFYDANEEDGRWVPSEQFYSFDNWSRCDQLEFLRRLKMFLAILAKNPQLH